MLVINACVNDSKCSNKMNAAIISQFLMVTIQS